LPPFTRSSVPSMRYGIPIQYAKYICHDPKKYTLMTLLGVLLFVHLLDEVWYYLMLKQLHIDLQLLMTGYKKTYTWITSNTFQLPGESSYTFFFRLHQSLNPRFTAGTFNHGLKLSLVRFIASK
jgi:hypothetical protein